MVSSIKFISGRATKIAPAMRPAPTPLQLLGWPCRISALTTEISFIKLFYVFFFW